MDEHKLASETVHFRSETDILVPSVTADQMREVDRIAVQETGPNLFQMMENAGRNLALFAIEVLGRRWKNATFLIMAGGGGNGGGAICCARHLANRDLNVRLWLSDPAHMNQIAEWQRKTFQFTGGMEIASPELPREHPAVIIDGLIGYGLTSSPSAQVSHMIQWANHSGAPILALDVPSGLDATTGEAPGTVVCPQWTMTLALPKTGLAGAVTGDLYLADIGIPREVYRRMNLHYQSPFGNQYRVRLAKVPASLPEQINATHRH
jgi:NAD(P)H-hydrate epimerase